jgi:hypothetical protein
VWCRENGGKYCIRMVRDLKREKYVCDECGGAGRNCACVGLRARKNGG